MAADPSLLHRSSTAITDLGVDTLAHCASYLSLRDISNMAMSCRYFNQVACSDSIWQSLYRQEWPHVGPPTHHESSIREAYLSRHTAIRQFKYVDPQRYDTYLVGKPPHSLLFDKKAIIFSQGSSLYSVRTDDLIHEGISSAPQSFSFEARGNHNARVTCMRLFSRTEANQCQNESERDDNVLITSSSDHFIHLWSKGGNRCFKGHTGPVLTLSDKLLGNGNGKILASGGEDGTVRLWSVNSSGKRGQQALKATLYGHEKAVPLMSVAGHKPSLLVSISKNGKVRVWDTTAASSSNRSSCCVGMASVPVAPVGMKCHESLLYVAAGSSVMAVDLRTMYKAFTVAQQEKIYSFEFLPSKSLLCTGGTGRGKLWDIRRVSNTQKIEPTAELHGHIGPIKHIHMDSYKIVTGGPDDSSVNVWEVDTGRQTNSLLCSAPPDGEPVLGCSALAVDGCRIVTAGGISQESTAVFIRDFRNATHYQASTGFVSSNESEAKPYAYSYTPGDSSPGFSKCLGSIWTGKDRYLWIDLGAGPVDYGPALSGDGVLPKGEFHPMAALHGRPKSQKALLADLASLVSSAYQVLLVPSLRIPVPFENKLVVEFIHINAGGGSVGLDWDSIERTFREEVNDRGLLLGDQSLRFKKYEVNFAECSICSFAITRATTSYTSRYLFDNYTLIVSEYLDSKRLHQTILESVEEFRRVGKVPEEDFGRVLPVYVFDLDFNAILLLDRYHQSVAFKDMVIAVRTRSTQTVSDYSCNGHHVFTQTRELERPLVGSILQSMWGVSPTHLVWSPRHNSSLMDYTWSVGQTPFGPFSEIPSLSFVQKDAARRNVLLTSLNYSITSGVDVLGSIVAHGGERKLLGHNRRTEFYQRWNLFRYKLEKSISALSHFDYEMALYYLKSSDHDLYAMHTLVYHASQELEASLVCFEDPPFPWSSFLLSIGICFALLFVYAKRDKLFHNKRKQF
ncbi:transmembrane protein [Perilla frutescens var. frutescens]|nr:transmembrane protein [Perilla frutescens var. frutescens]